MRRTRTRTKLEIRNRRQHKSAFSPSENKMMSLGLFASSSASSSSSSSSSSNLSPLALPFTVERSNYNKFNLGTNSDSHFNFNGKSDGAAFWSSSPNFQSSTTTPQGLLADSIRTATVPSTYSTFSNPIPNPNPNPITITAPSTHNRSSIPAVYLSSVDRNPHEIDASFSTIPSPITTSSSTHSWSSVPAVNLSAIGPNQRLTDASFATFSRAFDAPITHNWSSMNSSVKSGLESVSAPAGHVFGVNPNSQPHKWSLGDGVGVNEAPTIPLDFSLMYGGSSQVSYSQGLSGSKYSGQANGSRGKEDSSMFGPMFGRPVTRENSVGPSVIGTSHGASSSATCHGLVSSGFPNEHTFTWDDYTALYSFDTGSVLYDSSSDYISPTVTTKSLDSSTTSPFNKSNILVSHNPLKEKESCHAVGFDYKPSLISQVPDINSTEEVNAGAHLSEHLDHHNPGEDSPCWKGAPTHFSSSGTPEQEPSQHPMKKLQNNSASVEDALLHMDQSLHGTVENMVLASETLDVNLVVKALNNLSELLLRLYSKDECGLKEQDHKALDHVIANLNVCMSSKIQQVDPAQKCSSPQQIASNVLREERNNDQVGKNIEELQGAYVRDESLPKDYNMVQKIKTILDEDLEFKEDSPSDPLLYKNLWLEAEAELCVSSYKARLHRAKREMGKSKALDSSDVASEIKKIPSSNFSPTAPKLLHEAAGSKTLNTDAPHISLPIVDDVENLVMARFNILKRREESNPVNMAEKESADIEASGNKIQSSGVAEGPHLQHLLDTDDPVVVHSQGNQTMQSSLAMEDVDHAFMARLSILKSRVERDPVNAQVSEKGVGTSMMQNQFGSLTTYNASSFGWEYVN